MWRDSNESRGFVPLLALKHYIENFANFSYRFRGKLYRDNYRYRIIAQPYYHVSCLCVQRDFLHIAMWLLAGPSQKCFFKWFILFCFSVIYVVFVLSSSRNCRSDCLKRIVRGFLFLKKTVHLNCSNTSQYYVCLFFNCICHLINAALVSMRIFSKTLQNCNYFNF